MQIQTDSESLYLPPRAHTGFTFDPILTTILSIGAFMALMVALGAS